MTRLFPITPDARAARNAGTSDVFRAWAVAIGAAGCGRCATAA